MRLLVLDSDCEGEVAPEYLLDICIGLLKDTKDYMEAVVQVAYQANLSQGDS
jgi:hypothetical protein